MRILLLCYRFNSLSQRIYCELSEKGHQVSVELDVHPELMIEAVNLFKPDLVVATFLRRKIPREVYSSVPTLVIHPGPPGDRGAFSLDWAILESVKEWGVCIIEAVEEYDAGDIYAYRTFKMPFRRKSSIYRSQITQFAVECLWETIEKIDKGIKPIPQKEGYLRDAPPDSVRRIDWEKDTTEVILRKIYAFDSNPGAIGNILGEDYLVFNAHRESLLKGKPGEIITYRGDGICVGTSDGAIWIGYLRKKEKESIKLPSTIVLESKLNRIRESKLEPWESYDGETYREIVYEEKGQISIIHFNFYNGAMGTRHCVELLKTIKYARKRPTKIIVLFGSEDFWSNGLNLNIIENAESPADESWQNINALDDVCEEILRATDKYVICAMQGNAGAGGAFFALVGDVVIARRGIILNPHYKNIGNLYGSEFWTYTFPKKVREDIQSTIMGSRLPISADKAKEYGFVDLVIEGTQEEFREKVIAYASQILPEIEKLIYEKKLKRERDESIKPLSKYREEELRRMWQNFYGFDQSYHIARYYFVRRTPPYRTPFYLAKHRV